MSEDDSGKRREAALAAVTASGERGYLQLTVEDIVEASGVSREKFDELFAGKPECYALGYGIAMEELSTEMLAACEARPDLPRKMIAGMQILAAKIANEPMLARGLLAEVHLAGGVALRKRDEYIRRFEEALEAAQESSTNPPLPITGAFVVGMVEAVAARSLREKNPSLFTSAIPDLMFIAVTVYLGREAAEAAYERFRFG